jgi:phage shock protein E
MRRFPLAVLAALLAVTTGCAANDHPANDQAANDHAASEHAATEHAASEHAATEHAATEHSASAGIERLDPAAFAQQVSDNRYVINVHVPDEGSLAGTDLTLPFDQVESRAAELPADRATPLAIYCMTDHMSGIAGKTLTVLGYTDIVELAGGMQAWQAAGRPIIPPNG